MTHASLSSIFATHPRASRAGALVVCLTPVGSEECAVEVDLQENKREVEGGLLKSPEEQEGGNAARGRPNVGVG